MGSADNQSQLSLQLQNRKPIKLSDIKAPEYTPSSDDCIHVHTVWTSGIRRVTTSKDGRSFGVCHFIFADDTGHISASIAFSDVDKMNAHNICKLLEEPKIFKITGFTVKMQWSLSGTLTGGALKHQSKRFELSISSKNILPVGDRNPTGTPFHTWIPFEFVELMEIDQVDCGSLVDVIAFVGSIENKAKQVGDSTLYYQRLLLCSSIDKENSYRRQLAVFGDILNCVTCPGVYAFSNLKVGDFRLNVSLSTTYLTVVQKITRATLSYWLPPQYRCEQFVTELVNGENALEITPSPTAVVPLGPSCPRRRILSMNNSEAGAISPSKRPRLLPAEEIGDNSSTQHAETFGSMEVQPGPSTANGVSCANRTEEKIYDFMKNTKPLKVNVKLATDWLDTDNDCYPMRSNTRGVALIILNEKYPPSKSGESRDRKGGAHDARNIKNVLQQCGNFHIVIKYDVESTQLEDIIESFKKETEENFPDADSLFVAVLSHGSFGYMEMVDGKFVNFFDDIIYPFDGIGFPVMKRKPKVFISQACQDFLIPHPTKICNRLEESHQRNAGGLENMLICFPTSPGSTALRDIYMGSPFIHVLADVIMKHAHELHFMQILEKVQKDLKNIDHELKDILSCYWIPYAFDKKLFLNPGLGKQLLKKDVFQENTIDQK